MCYVFILSVIHGSVINVLLMWEPGNMEFAMTNLKCALKFFYASLLDMQCEGKKKKWMNHGMVWVGGALTDHLVSAPLLLAGTPPSRPRCTLSSSCQSPWATAHLLQMWLTGSGSRGSRRWKEWSTKSLATSWLHRQPVLVQDKLLEETSSLITYIKFSGMERKAHSPSSYRRIQEYQPSTSFTAIGIF